MGKEGLFEGVLLSFCLEMEGVPLRRTETGIVHKNGGRFLATIHKNMIFQKKTVYKTILLCYALPVRQSQRPFFGTRFDAGLGPFSEVLTPKNGVLRIFKREPGKGPKTVF